MARKARTQVVPVSNSQASPPLEPEDPPEDFEVEQVDAERLQPHPRNYKAHPADQLEHIASLIRQFGIYKNVVVAADYTLLAGHGVVEAATKLVGLRRIPVRRMPFGPSDPRALKILAADNTVPGFGETDDRSLSEILREVRETVGLVGTGYDDQRLAALVMVTRPVAEIRDSNAAAEWVGMPEYDEGGSPIRLIVTFADAAARKEFIDRAQMKVVKQVGETWSARWPTVENEDVHSMRFEGK